MARKSCLGYFGARRRTMEVVFGQLRVERMTKVPKAGNNSTLIFPDGGAHIRSNPNLAVSVGTFISPSFCNGRDGDGSGKSLIMRTTSR